MPLYSFVCITCGNEFEEILFVDDRDYCKDHFCAKCGGFSIHRKLSAPNFVINGYSEKNGYSRKDGGDK